MDRLEQLEKAYNYALSLEKSGKLDQAAEAWRKVLELDPEDHGGAAVRLASMRRGTPPERAPRAYVETLFDQTAEVFDEVLVDHLGYRVPVLLLEMLEEAGVLPARRILDLGCGTGLTGEALRERASYIVGVDLSENMVAHAWDRKVYDDLFVGEAVQFLEEEEENFDLVAATDVIPYFGEIRPFFAAAAAIVEAGGYLAFSTETLPREDFEGRAWTVGPYQRFAHKLSHVEDELQRAGFEVVRVLEIVVRHEQGEPVPGHLVLARKLAQAD